MEFNYEKCCIFEFPNEDDCFSVGYLEFIRNKPATTIFKPSNEIFKVSWPMCSIKSPRQMLKMKNVDYKSVPAKIIAVGNYDEMVQACVNLENYGSLEEPSKEERKNANKKETKTSNQFNKKASHRKPKINNVKLCEEIFAHKIKKTDIRSDKEDEIEKPNSKPNKQDQTVYTNSQLDKQDQTVYTNSQLDKQDRTEYTNSQLDKQDQTKDTKSRPSKQDQTEDTNSMTDKQDQTEYTNSQLDKQDQIKDTKSRPSKQDQTKDTNSMTDKQDQTEDTNSMTDKQDQTEDTNSMTDKQDQTTEETNVMPKKAPKKLEKLDELGKRVPVSNIFKRSFEYDSDSSGEELFKKSKSALMDYVEIQKMEIKRLRKELTLYKNMSSLTEVLPKLIDTCQKAIQDISSQSEEVASNKVKTVQKDKLKKSTPTSSATSNSFSFDKPSCSTDLPQIRQFLKTRRETDNSSHSNDINVGEVKANISDILSDVAIRKCDHKRPSKLLNDLLTSVFSNKVLASCSLTGRKSNAKPNSILKPQLDPIKLEAIFDYIQSIFPENLESKRTNLEKIVRIKLNNESKRKS